MVSRVKCRYNTRRKTNSPLKISVPPHFAYSLNSKLASMAKVAAAGYDYLAPQCYVEPFKCSADPWPT
jgi:hypothetical protein